jgi:hypothetical protein
MSSAIMSLIVSHLLTFLESELAKNEPQILAVINQDIQLLIAKLEALLKIKAPTVAAVVNPVVEVAGIAADAGIQAIADHLVQQA